MATDYRSVLAKCPFYAAEDNLRITCEGVDEYSTLVLNFKKRPPKDRHAKAFCDEYYEKCMIYRMLMEKYD